MQKQITTTELAGKMDKGFEEIRQEFKNVRQEMSQGFKQVNQSIEDLAIMTQNGFVAMQERVDKRFDGVDDRLNAIEKIVDSHDVMFEQVMKEIKELRREVAGQTYDIVNVEKRVVRLEKKVGL